MTNMMKSKSIGAMNSINGGRLINGAEMNAINIECEEKSPNNEKEATLTRTSRIVVKPTNQTFKSYKQLCHLCKNLYNYANYLIRQEYIANKKLIKEYDLTTRLAKDKQADYVALPAQTAQQVIKLLYKNYKSFFGALKAYSKDNSKFKSCPRLPKYKAKDGVSIAIFTNQQVKLKSGENNKKNNKDENKNNKGSGKRVNKLIFPTKASIKPLRVDGGVSSIKQVRVVPQATCFVVEIIYTKSAKPLEQISLVKDSFLSIDLGLNNFVTSIDNQSKFSFIINGRGMKSINQYYNKRLSHLRSIAKVSNDRFSTKQINRLTLKRNNRIDNFLHHAANHIVAHCKAHRIKSVIVGYNQDLKHEIRFGNITNQNFVQIPFLSFTEKLRYKLEEFGATLILTEESYTSKIDHFAGESMEHHDRYKGKRVKRGLFRSSTKRLINADVNGAIGIARKVFCDATQRLADSGVALTPIKINIAC